MKQWPVLVPLRVPMVALTEVYGISIEMLGYAVASKGCSRSFNCEV